MRTESPQLDTALLRDVQDAWARTDRDGWAVLPTPVLARDAHSAQVAEQIARVHGDPTRTSPTVPVIAWPVTPGAGTTRTTFSQTTGEADFHTDSGYYAQPERYFALFCVHADAPGRGTNRLIDSRPVLAALDARTRTALALPFPFRVPSIFTADGSDATEEVTWQPIAHEGTIRWRRDTLQDALALPGVDIGAAQRLALARLQEALAVAPVLEHHLQPGEALLVDNHRMLHARTPFTDERRFLYRVRMHAR